MSKINLSYYGTYSNNGVLGPIALSLTGSSGPVILTQDWFDFTTMPEANINLFLGLQIRQVSAGGFYPNFGIFIATDGDLVAANLFTSILPVLQVPCSGLTGVYKGVSNTATFANPNAAMQVVMAYVPVATGGGATGVYQLRSGLLDGKGV
jgi:hypothetical protein